MNNNIDIKKEDLKRVFGTVSHANSPMYIRRKKFIIKGMTIYAIDKQQANDIYNLIID